MPAWETIIEEYLEGAGSRAAAESLRFRIALAPEARQEVETVLRLADRLSDATQSVRPPIGAADRLSDHLLLTGQPGIRPRWVKEGSEFAAPEGAARPGADEDAVNDAIEGAADLTTKSVDSDHNLDAFKRIATTLRRGGPSSSDGSAPSGAIGRLRMKLADSLRAGEGGASPVVARRILAQLRGEPARPAPAFRPPDVLAAGNEPDEESDPGKQLDDSDDPSQTT